MERIKGTVKWFNNAKGYGFIGREDARMFSFTAPRSWRMATKACMKGTRLISKSPTGKKVRRSANVSKAA